MFESDDGLITPVTRQKAGRLGRALPLGTVKPPAGTASARAIAVAGSSSLFKVSQVWAAGARCAQAATASTARVVRDVGCGFMGSELLLNIRYASSTDFGSCRHPACRA